MNRTKLDRINLNSANESALVEIVVYIMVSFWLVLFECETKKKIPLY